MSNGQDNKKIRVGFFPPENKNWMGGVNYYKNLFFELKQNDEIEIVIFLPPKNDNNELKLYVKYYEERYFVNNFNKRKIETLINSDLFKLKIINKFRAFIYEKNSNYRWHRLSWMEFILLL